jgi:hypothetical protein
MQTLGRALFAGVLLTLLNAPAAAQFGMGRGGQTPVVAVLTPTGALAEVALTGIGAALHTSFTRGEQEWGTRASFGIERFNGKKPVLSIQYLMTGFDVVHNSGRLYQFGGFMFASGRTNYDESAPFSGDRRASSGFDIGITGGIGMHFGRPSSQVRPFLEAGYVNTFRDGGNDTWVPVRFGIRF